MTIPQIRLKLRAAGKKVSRVTLYTYFDRFKIKPIGVRQCPQRFPDDAADRIIKKLGLKPNGHRSKPRH